MPGTAGLRLLLFLRKIPLIADSRLNHGRSAQQHYERDHSSGVIRVVATLRCTVQDNVVDVK